MDAVVPKEVAGHDTALFLVFSDSHGSAVLFACILIVIVDWSFAQLLNGSYYRGASDLEASVGWPLRYRQRKGSRC